MNKEEAAKAGVEDRRSYFRVEKDKANMAPPANRADWCHLVSVALPNGDNVGVATKWTWPDAFEGVGVTDLRKVQAAIAAGRWRESAQAKDWAGIAVAHTLGLDPANKAHKAKIAALLKTWISTGMLAVVEALDAKREKRNFIEVGEPAND